MQGRTTTKLALWLVILHLPAAAALAADGRRVALVIGNSAYTAVEKLANPGADATLVAESLKRAGFTSVDVKRNLGKAALDAAVRDFGQKTDGADLALIYYAGHGIEVGGQNFLVPTDARLVRDRDVEVEATRLETLLNYSEGARLRVVILDACRNNPFAAQLQRSVKTRSIGRGLGAIEPEGETLVVYAAKAGATASDGDGANSPFAEALARRLPEPGVEINMVFRRVRDDVLQRTARAQEPFTYGSLSGSEFYFVPASGKPAAQPQPAATAGVAAAGSGSELEYWRGTVAADTEGAYRSYLKRYPRGEFTDLANENLKRVTRRTDAQPSAAGAAPPAASTATLAQADAADSPAAAQRSAAAPSFTEGVGALSQLVTAFKDPRAAAQMRADAARQQQLAEQQARNELARQQALERQQAQMEQRQQQQQQAQMLAEQRASQRLANASQSGTASAAAQSGVAGLWRGEFVCGQNTAAMQLTLQQSANGSVQGQFEFAGTPQSPGPSGSFTVQGRFANSRLQLSGGRWIVQPPGYSTRPGLEGYLSPDGRSINGRLLTTNCGAMHASKVSP